MPNVNILVLKYPLFKNTNTHIQQKKTHQRPLLAPHGAAGGVAVPLAKQGAEKRAPCVLVALAISTGTAKTKPAVSWLLVEVCPG